MRVERPPHYDTFGEFQYSYHYGDMYAPYIKQEEPLKTECQHFLDCIKTGAAPMSCGRRGTELVKILEASSESLRRGGAPVEFDKGGNLRRGGEAGQLNRVAAPVVLTEGLREPRPAGDLKVVVKTNGNGGGH